MEFGESKEVVGVKKVRKNNKKYWYEEKWFIRVKDIVEKENDGKVSYIGVIKYVFGCVK